MSKNKKPNSMAGKNSPVVETQMLVRKPVATVFQAFIDPTITSNFWFTKSSGKLEVGKTIKWEWEMYDMSTNVLVKEIIPNKKISIDWSDPVTAVDFIFNPLTDNTTYVTIKNYGFDLKGEDLIKGIMDNASAFTTVLDGLKAFLEYNINLNLIVDKFPDKLAHQLELK